MALTGVSKSFYAKYKEKTPGSGQYEYAEGRSFAKMTNISHTPETNTAELYTDNGLEEADYSFSKGAISVDVSNLEEGVVADLLGAKLETNGDTKELVYTAEDKTVEAGFGFVIQKKVNGAFAYRAIVLSRVVFKIPATSVATRQGTLSFQTEKIEGTTHPDRTTSRVWMRESTFGTEEAAVAYIKSKLNITEAAASTNVEPEE